jgi:Ca2+/Na+ antiporter
MNWINILVPVLEAILFLAPFIRYVYSYGQTQQKQEDEIRHLKDRLEKQESNAMGIATMISNLQTAVAKLETKIDFLLENNVNGKE